ncbi:MAG: thioredoxin family protein [Rikenellaceae bacterium]|jgi:thiol:disulfide interchange protein DsbD|nr:thioredoxin family protein [Rikenellaceae bacterium]
MKKILLLFAGLFGAVVAVGQPADVGRDEGRAVWKTSVVPLEGVRYDVVFEARITPAGWHIYDLGPYTVPMATVFDFAASSGLELVGSVRQTGEPTRYFDELFGFEVGYFEGVARFAQTVEVTASEAVLAGEIEYQLCSDQACILGEWEFAVPVAGSEAAVVSEAHNTAPTNNSTGGNTLWAMILEAILWGFAALLTPCVFPMVPMTVSFFMKGGENKTIARFRALAFGLFIVALYTLPIAVIILVTYFAGGEAVTADIFNWLATAWIPNVLFFVVFMLFAASLLGAFEIRMPGKLVNNADRNAERKGLTGIFFLALTLVLVSFSCTGPIVGTVLIKSTQGEFWAPILTMLCFSVAFALPFTLLAFFPGLLTRMPKSGGWLNSVKVVLGLVEIALGLKFLSVADQTYHWGILDREVYLAVWIVVFAILGFYLLGKIRFKYDSEVQTVGVGRLAGAIVVFSFVVYMIPGMWGAPLKALSGYLPPMSTQDFIASGGGSRTTEMPQEGIKYADILTLPHGMTGYFDFEQGMEHARAVGKPVFLDFTGHGCVNCREMEERVWVDPTVQQILRDEYVVIALYSDDRTPLAPTDRIITPAGKELKTIGKKNSHLLNSRYGVGAQPAYLLLDNQGELLAPPRGYNLDIAAYIDFLRSGVAKYHASND